MCRGPGSSHILTLGGLHLHSVEGVLAGGGGWICVGGTESRRGKEDCDWYVN